MTPISILHLEDSLIDADLADALLTGAGIDHETTRVETEEAFTAALQNHCFDLILADYVLPDFDGLSALDLARTLAPDVPFVFVSGAMGEENAIDSLHRGATDYVLKHRLKRLVPAVRRALAEAHERKARLRAEREREDLLRREQAARADAEAQARHLAHIIQELEQFAYAASHDLQEPLRMVKSYSQLLCRQFASHVDQQGASYLNYIEQGVSRMEALIKDLLCFSRHVHAGRQNLEMMDLSSVVEEVLTFFEPQIQDTRAEISIGQLPTVWADRQRIASVFQNLISNSLKYRSAETPYIRISARDQGGSWVFSVSDNGIGFSPEYADRIFGLFKRLHREEYPGTGVGLALVKQVVEQHGGGVWAESTPGRGATFHFTLPVSDDLMSAAIPA